MKKVLVAAALLTVLLTSANTAVAATYTKNCQVHGVLQNYPGTKSCTTGPSGIERCGPCTASANDVSDDVNDAVANVLGPILGLPRGVLDLLLGRSPT